MELYTAPIPPTHRYLQPTAFRVLLPAVHRRHHDLCSNWST